MPLESLMTLVEKLREQIDAHGSLLRQNEALTRYTLIDPLLRELGWDTEDPALVIPEYTGLGGSADYALFNGDKPLMIVEAKKLNTSLRDGKVLNQGLNYCQQEGTPYLVVTDGRRWDIYETHKLASIDEKRIVEFDLKSQSAAEACLKALTLWGLRVSGQVALGQTPVVGPSHNQPDSLEPPTPSPQPTPSSPDEHEWQPLSELNPRSESHPPPPVAVRFPDNSDAQVSSWGGPEGLLVGIARWLINGNHLIENHCPIPRRPGGTKSLVSTGSVTPPERYNRVGSLYIYTNLPHAGIINACRTIIKHVGQDPAQFKVRFA